MTEEQALEQATATIEELKPMYMQMANGDLVEYTDSQYNQRIQDEKEVLLDEYNNGYIRARQEAYGSIADQLDMQYWDAVNGTTTWKDHIAQVKSDNPKPE
jgi:hypothetical protein